MGINIESDSKAPQAEGTNSALSGTKASATDGTSRTENVTEYFIFLSACIGLSLIQSLPWFRRPARRSNSPQTWAGLGRHVSRPLSSRKLRTRNAHHEQYHRLRLKVLYGDIAATLDLGKIADRLRSP
jgi:hypothetical protein